MEIMNPTPNAEGRRAFTIIELLVVILIIGILVAFAFPAFQGVLERAKKVQAKNDLTQIVTAVNAFYTEYGRYPTNATTDATATYGPGGSTAENGNLFSELRATTTAFNTRQIVFISPPDARNQTNPRSGIKTTTSSWYDPWGSEYAIAIDANYDNQVTNPYGNSGGAGANPIRQGVIAWCLGKNGVLGGGAATDKTKFSDEPGSAGAFTNSGDVISWQ
jgi:prepilin-type N-terminal cleavage/methylation domain-containing protein